MGFAGILHCSLSLRVGWGLCKLLLKICHYTWVLTGALGKGSPQALGALISSFATCKLNVLQVRMGYAGFSACESQRLVSICQGFPLLGRWRWEVLVKRGNV